LTLDISPAGKIAKLTDRPESDLPGNPLVQALKECGRSHGIELADAFMVV
jgi:hypothetical protein